MESTIWEFRTTRAERKRMGTSLKKRHRSIQEITRKVRQEGSTTAACTEIVNAHETPTVLSQRCRGFMVSDFTAKP